MIVWCCHGESSDDASQEVQLQSLMGHVLYGLTVGLVVQAFIRVSEDSRVTSRA